MRTLKKIISADLHIHTRASIDVRPEITIATMMHSAAEKNITAIAITDHNSLLEILANKDSLSRISQNIQNENLIPPEVIFGVELSFFWGHILVLGIDPYLIQKRLIAENIALGHYQAWSTKKQRLSWVQWANDQGGIVIVPHPMAWFLSIGRKELEHWHNLGLIHGAEIHNGDLERKLSFMPPLLHYWRWHTERVIKQLGIPAIGNSDAHTPENVGRYTTTYAHANATELITAFRNKNVQILEIKKLR